VPPEQYMALWRRILFVIYAIVSWVYRWVITFTILWFMSTFLGPKLKVISQMLAVASAASLVGWPLYRLGKGIHKRGRLPDMKPVRVTISLLIVFAILVAFFTVPLPVSRVRQTALVQIDPEHVAPVWLQHSGILTEVNCKDGQHVQERTILARFRSFELEQEQEQAAVQARIHAERARAYVELRQQSSDLRQEERDELDRKIQQARAESERFRQQADTIDRFIDQILTVRADRAGIVMSPPRVDEVGKYWDAKEQPKPFCRIGDPKQLRAIMPVGPDDYNLLVSDRKALQEKGQDLAVTLRIQGRENQTWEGTLTELPQSAAKEVPLQLTTRANGPLAIKPNPSRPNALEPQAQQYLVHIAIENPDDAICPGAFAQAKVHCQWRSCGWWTWRSFASLFDLGMEPWDLLPRVW
jgi:putative peptide zinc metalloprotease protein